MFNLTYRIWITVVAKTYKCIIYNCYMYKNWQLDPVCWWHGYSASVLQYLSSHSAICDLLGHTLLLVGTVRSAGDIFFPWVLRFSVYTHCIALIIGLYYFFLSSIAYYKLLMVLFICVVVVQVNGWGLLLIRGMIIEHPISVMCICWEIEFLKKSVLHLLWM